MLIFLILKNSVNKGFCDKGQKRSAFRQTLNCKLLAIISISIPASSSTVTSSNSYNYFSLLLEWWQILDVSKQIILFFYQLQSGMERLKNGSQQ